MLDGVSIALDATYSIGRNLSGVGVYSRRLMTGLAEAHPDERFLYYYRPHRFLRAFRGSVPRNARRKLLRGAPSGDVFHALNQRVDRPGKRTVATFHDLFVLTGEYSSLDADTLATLAATYKTERDEAAAATTAHAAKPGAGNEEDLDSAVEPGMAQCFAAMSQAIVAATPGGN